MATSNRSPSGASKERTSTSDSLAACREHGSGAILARYGADRARCHGGRPDARRGGRRRSHRSRGGCAGRSRRGRVAPAGTPGRAGGLAARPPRRRRHRHDEMPPTCAPPHQQRDGGDAHGQGRRGIGGGVDGSLGRHHGGRALRPREVARRRTPRHPRQHPRRTASWRSSTSAPTPSAGPPPAAVRGDGVVFVRPCGGSRPERRPDVDRGGAREGERAGPAGPAAPETRVHFYGNVEGRDLFRD